MTIDEITEYKSLSNGLYAEIVTNKGKILIILEYKKVPLAVTNFVGLVEGRMRTTFRKGKPFYENLIFHRVIEDFIIQTGDPTGNGNGGPGYKFQDEILPELKFDKIGVVGMANVGPDTNGSQFFITKGIADDLNDRYTIFGFVKKGQSTAKRIKKGDVVQKINIIRIGEEAKSFEGNHITFNKILEEYELKRTEKLRKANESILKQININWPDARRTESGIRYMTMEEGNGNKVESGLEITIQYTVTFVSGKKIHNIKHSNSNLKFVVGENIFPKQLEKVIIEMFEGEKRIIILPPISPDSCYSFKEKFPYNYWLVFDINLVSIS